MTSGASDQWGLSRRADWRFLLPGASSQPVTHVLLVGERQTTTAADTREPDAESGQESGAESGAESNEEHPLVADGWAAHVSVDLNTIPAELPPPDLVVVWPGAAVESAVAFAADAATVVVKLDRGWRSRLERIRALRAAGFEPRDHYLVTPNLAEAKRYVSLDRSDAIGWLLAPPPPVAGTAGRLRRFGHRLVISAVSNAVSVAASIPMLAAVVGGATHGLVIASRGGHRPNTSDGAEPPPVLMTSGHDEGSRAVLVDLDHQPGDSPTVTKLSPRPRYNGNADAEADVIGDLRMRMHGDRAANAERLLPEIETTVEVGRLRGTRERYAGRWTASDLGNRVPNGRVPMLHRVLSAIDDFTLATAAEPVPWSDQLFTEHVTDLFDRYRTITGPAENLDALQAALAERSADLAGVPFPTAQRHYDLGPWNVVVNDDGDRLTIIDWELTPPRTPGRPGPAGADQLYFTKYWLHLAMESTSIDDELTAFPFIAGRPQAAAADAVAESLTRLHLDRRFVPLVTTHVWLEKALYTAARRSDADGTPGDAGSATRYLTTLAARRDELLAFWA
ncbi:MAG: phosphotransferase [Actinomycetota bacterium]